MRRLAIPAVLAVGEICGFVCPSLGAAWPLTVFLLVAVVLLGHGMSIRWWHLAAIFILGLSLSLRSVESRSAVLRDIMQSGRPFESSLVVERVPSEGPGSSGWTWFDTAYRGVALRVLFKPSDTARLPAVGEIWRCSGWVSHSDAQGYRRVRVWARGRGAYVEPDPSAGVSHVRMFFDSLRRNFSRRLGIGVDGTEYQEIADVNRAILLGERSRLSGDAKAAFLGAGTIHIFAISGLHVMIVAKVILVLLTFTMLPIRAIPFVAIPAIWLYVCVSGMAPSAARAATMASICMAAPVFGRKPDGLSAWVAAFVVFHVARPDNLMNVGSLLSFVVMLGMLVFLEWAKVFGSTLVETVGVVFAAWLSAAPIVAHVFGRITPGGIFANAVLAPVSGLSVGTGLLGVLSSFVSETLAAHLNFAAALFTKAMVGVSWVVSLVPGASVETGRWSLWGCAAWYFVLGLSMWLVRSVVLRRRASLA